MVSLHVPITDPEGKSYSCPCKHYQDNYLGWTCENCPARPRILKPYTRFILQLSDMIKVGLDINELDLSFEDWQNLATINRMIEGFQ